MATAPQNYQEQSFVGTPLIKWANPNDEDFCRKLNRVVNGYGFDGTWKGGTEIDTATIYARHQNPDSEIGTMDAPGRAFELLSANTTPELQAQVEDLCTRYGITYSLV